MNFKIDDLCTKDIITKDEHEILFEPKDNYNDVQTKKFNDVLEKVITIFNETTEIDLSYIHFPKFDFHHKEIEKKLSLMIQFFMTTPILVRQSFY